MSEEENKLKVLLQRVIPLLDQALSRFNAPDPIKALQTPRRLVPSEEEPQDP